MAAMLVPLPPPQTGGVDLLGSDLANVTKALRSAADEVVVDLEDAATPPREDKARRDLALLNPRSDGGAITVRVNGPRTPRSAEDLRAVAALAVADTHHDARVSGAGRLVYGGHTIMVGVSADLPGGVVALDLRSLVIAHREDGDTPVLDWAYTVLLP